MLLDFKGSKTGEVTQTGQGQLFYAAMCIGSLCLSLVGLGLVTSLQKGLFGSVSEPGKVKIECNFDQKSEPVAKAVAPKSKKKQKP